MSKPLFPAPPADDFCDMGAFDDAAPEPIVPGVATQKTLAFVAAHKEEK